MVLLYFILCLINFSFSQSPPLPSPPIYYSPTYHTQTDLVSFNQVVAIRTSVVLIFLVGIFQLIFWTIAIYTKYEITNYCLIVSVSELCNCVTRSHFALYVCMYLCQSRLGPGAYQVTSYASAAHVSHGYMVCTRAHVAWLHGLHNGQRTPQGAGETSSAKTHVPHVM